jgi:stage IV sporulation protein FB
MHHGRNDEALKLLQRIRQESHAGVLYNTASEHMANLLYEQGHYKDAYALLAPIRKELTPESLKLLHQLAYKNDDWTAAAALGNSVYQQFPSCDTALINAFSYALLGDVRPAVGWLQCAVKDGLPNKNEFLKRPEFDKIRQDPLFQGLKPG